METLELVPIESEATAKPAAVPPAAAEAPASKRTELALLDMKEVALARFGDWRTDAKALVEKFKDVVFDTSTRKGLKELTDALAEVRAPRFKAQNVDKEFASEVTKIRKAVGAEKEEIIAFLKPTEDHLEALHEAHKKREAEKAEKEAARKRGHEERLATLRGYVAKAHGLPADRIANGIVAVEAIIIDPANWEEYAEQAAQTKADTLAALRELHAKAVEDERIRAEAARREQVIAALQVITGVVTSCIGKSSAFIEERIDALSVQTHADDEVTHARANAIQQLGALRQSAMAFEAQQEAARRAPAPEPLEPEKPASAPETAVAENVAPLVIGVDLASGPDMHSDVVYVFKPAEPQTPPAVAPAQPAGRIVHKARPLPEDQRLIDAAALAKQFGAEEIGGTWIFGSTSDLADLIDAARA